MTIANVLKVYGFEARRNHSLWFGVGSLVWGHTAEVEPIGKNLYKVHYREWFYNCEGDCLKDEDEIRILPGALLLQYLVEKLPWLFK